MKKLRDAVPGLDRLMHRARIRLRSPADQWNRGIGEEIAFWRDLLDSAGSQWAKDYENRLDPKAPLADYVTRYIRAPKGATVRILDVGAGPLTSLGKCHPDYSIEITAVDALAEEYDSLLSAAGIIPLVRTLKCHSEHLTDMFQPASFAISHASNTLDHSYDPLRAIRQMAQVTEQGGVLILDHFRNEAEHEGYAGFHQWNFAPTEGDLLIWRPGRKYRLQLKLADLLQFERLEHEDEDTRREIVVFRRI
jgi:SAM-dependent methyltransferase